MIKYIIIGYICLFIGACFGFTIATILSIGKRADKEAGIDG